MSVSWKKYHLTHLTSVQNFQCYHNSKILLNYEGQMFKYLRKSLGNLTKHKTHCPCIIQVESVDI